MRIYEGQTGIDTLFLIGMSDYSFDVWVKERRTKRRLTGPQLAELAKTTKQTISSIERQAPHPISGAPYRPSVEMVDAIARALNEPLHEARRAAGYAGPRAEVSDEELERDRLTTLFFRRKKLNPKRRAEFDKILDMVDRELDRLEQEDRGN